MRRYSVGVLLGAFIVQAGSAHSACNTKSGFVANQPAPPDANRPLQPEPAAPPQMVVNKVSSHYDDQTLPLDLSADLTSLIGLTGRYTTGVPVLGVRMENLPGYDAKRYCNAIQPLVYKPKIEHLGDGQIKASVENGRFQLVFDPARIDHPWVRDADPSKRFFWIFPGRFPALGMPSIARSYDESFRQQPVGSDPRRWVAEAYLDLSMRFNRLREVNMGFPQGGIPTHTDLSNAVRSHGGITCSDGSGDLVCLAAKLIEQNETASPGPVLSKAAFTVGDALLQDSGVSTGIRQLDFGTANEQAVQLVGQLFPATLGRYKRGYGYRRAIRAWDIDAMNRWFDRDGLTANAELSREQSKRLILESYASFLSVAANKWGAAVDRAYPNWSPEMREGLALIAIDLENVSGYSLHLTPSARNVCTVLTDQTLNAKNRRSNRSVAHDEIRRIRNGREVLGGAPGFTPPDWTCLDGDLAD